MGHFRNLRLKNLSTTHFKIRVFGTADRSPEWFDGLSREDHKLLKFESIGVCMYVLKSWFCIIVANVLWL